MTSVIRDLWPSLCRGLLLLTAASGCALAPLRLALPAPLSVLLLCVLAGVLVVALSSAVRTGRWLLPFVAGTRRFRTASGDRVVLRYAPQLQEAADPQEVLAQAEEALAELEATFGRLSLFWRLPPLFRRRVHVYLFPTCEAVAQVFGKGHAGIALTAHHAVVFPFEVRPPAEWLRHEMAHLFSDRWNRLAPPLLKEGLSTWLQGTEQGRPIDALAAAQLGQEDCPPGALLDRRLFVGEASSWRCYVLAGSFSGFLIRAFGWGAYERFYRRQQGDQRFAARFRRQFGVTLEEAGRRWREELLGPRHARPRDRAADPTPQPVAAQDPPDAGERPPPRWAKAVRLALDTALAALGCAAAAVVGCVAGTAIDSWTGLGVALVPLGMGGWVWAGLLLGGLVGVVFGAARRRPLGLALFGAAFGAAITAAWEPGPTWSPTDHIGWWVTAAAAVGAAAWVVQSAESAITTWDRGDDPGPVR